MYRQLFITLLLLTLSLSSCTRRATSRSEGDGDTVSMRYAEMLTIVKHDGYSVVSLKDPWHENRTLHTYILVPKNAALPPHMPRGTVVRTPIKSSIVFTSAHCQLFYYLQAEDVIKGVCDLKYIHIPDLQRRVTTDKSAIDCGDGMQPMLERIIEIAPEALFISPFENSGGYGRLEEMAVPIIECADYMETSPLGRAEWMKFYAMLIGKSDEADRLFHRIDSTYQHLKNTARQSKTRRSILTERKTGSVWYTPGGRSTIGQLIKDASGDYAFSHDTHSGSLSLPFEKILDKASQSDVWAFKYNGDTMPTRAQLLSEYHGYALLKAFREGEVYGCNTTTKPYFEEVSFRPDLLLREFILLLHPDMSHLGQLRYYEKLSH